MREEMKERRSGVRGIALERKRESQHTSKPYWAWVSAISRYVILAQKFKKV
jgi:hypothetical protein